MTLLEIKLAQSQGKNVYWKTSAYEVQGDLIVFAATGDCIGLTWLDGTKLNGNEGDFFII